VVTAGNHAPPWGPRIAGGVAPVLRYGHSETVGPDCRVAGHSGGGPGWATNLDVFPGAGRAIVVLTNRDTSVHPIVDLGRQLVAAG
jgi:hypothetical protein